MSRVFLCSIIVVLLLTASAEAVVFGSWKKVQNVYTFRVASTAENVVSLELKFVPSPGSTFKADFEDTLFDADGIVAGEFDSLLLFPPDVIAPGALQGKFEHLLQAAFTSFTPFASKDVAQLVVEGTPGTPIPSSILPHIQPRLGTAVLEHECGDACPISEYPILPSEGKLLPEISPLVRDITLGVNDSELMDLQLAASDDLLPADELVWSDLVVEGPGKIPGFPAASDPFINAAGVFSWDPLGWRSGQYTFLATIVDQTNETTDVALTVNLTVPEPTSWSLLIVVVMGLTGFAPRGYFA